MSTGIWQRPDGHYTRPAGVLHLDDYCPTMEGANAWFASATSFYQDVLGRYPHETWVIVEMVPEPGNPWDSRAVALDVNGARVGYLPAYTAVRWHDLIRALNAAGLAVTQDGLIDRSARPDGQPQIGLLVSLPEHDDALVLAALAGLRAQHDAVIAQFSDTELVDLVEGCWSEYPNFLARRLLDLSHLAPDLTWSTKGPLAERVPYWHHAFVRDDINNQRERLRLLRAVRRISKRRIRDLVATQKAAAKAAAAEERAGRVDAARHLLADGHSLSAVSLDAPAFPPTRSPSCAARPALPRSIPRLSTPTQPQPALSAHTAHMPSGSPALPGWRSAKTSAWTFRRSRNSLRTESSMPTRAATPTGSRSRHVPPTSVAPGWSSTTSSAHSKHPLAAPCAPTGTRKSPRSSPRVLTKEGRSPRPDESRTRSTLADLPRLAGPLER